MFTIYDLRDIIQTAFWGGMLVLILIGWGILKANQARMRFYVAWLVIVLAGFIALILPSPKEYREAKERKQRYETGKAIFAERCKNAGEKIYRTVENVDGIMLLNVPIKPIGAENDPMYSGAAMMQDFSSMDYIAHFLNYATYNFSSTQRINKTYKFVDVIQNDRSIIRYSGVWAYFDRPFQTQINPKNPAQYAISLENNINTEDRKYWIAETSIKIIDLKNNEIIAERKIYAFEHGLGSKAHARQPWQLAEICPNKPKNYKFDYFYSFLFVQKVLKPSQDVKNVKY